MKLRLILKGPDRLMGAQAEKTMEQGSLVVGRSPTADWTLPDPERIVSKAHCRIDRDVSGFVLTDTSTNGVQIDNETVGFGLPRLLSDGNVLKLGDAVILVRVEDRPGAQVPAPSVPASPAIVPDGPFGLPESVAPAEEPALPVSAAAEVQGGPAGPILDDWWAPQEPLGLPANPISVDISTKEEQETIKNSLKEQDSLASTGGEGAILDLPLAGVDPVRFAKAVEAAALSLPDGERQRFHERLRDLLAGDKSPRE